MMKSEGEEKLEEREEVDMTSKENGMEELDLGEAVMVEMKEMVGRMEAGEEPEDEDWVRKGRAYVEEREAGKVLEKMRAEREEESEMLEWCEKVDRYMDEKAREDEDEDVGMGLWEVKRTAREIREEEEAERRAMVVRVRECERCPVCGKRAYGMIFGREKRGVWVGCDRSPECLRNLEIHLEGWSFEEVCDEWDRKNRGLNRWIRRMKMWWGKRFGAARRWEREFAKKEKDKKARSREELKEVITRQRHEAEGAEGDGE